MKPAEIRVMSEEQIKAKLIDLRQEAMNLRFQDVSGQISDYSRVREVRRDIARMETMKTVPSIDTVLKIVKPLGLQLSLLPISA